MDKRRLLFDFGESIAAPGNHLFILGDLFDFWFEWKRVIPRRHFVVLHHIRGWADKGLKLYYLAGNHDFRLGSFLREEIGFQTFEGALNFEAGGRKFHLFHGDGVMKSDAGYRFLKKVLRNRLNQKLFTALHPDWGIKLADLSSRLSREVNEDRRDYEFTPDYLEYARRKIEGEGFDFVIMAHTHLPLFRQIGKGAYLNTGNWYRDFTYGLFQGGELKLEKYQER